MINHSIFLFLHLLPASVSCSLSVVLDQTSSFKQRLEHLQVGTPGALQNQYHSPLSFCWRNQNPDQCFCPSRIDHCNSLLAGSQSIYLLQTKKKKKKIWIMLHVLSSNLKISFFFTYCMASYHPENTCITFSPCVSLSLMNTGPE